MDQADAGRIAPDQTGRAGHQIRLDPLGHHDPFVCLCGIFDHPFKGREIQLRVCQSMGQIKDRIVCILPVYAV